MTAILGISAFYHDSAAAILQDGKILAAAQQERFSRMKHDHSFPLQAIEYCLDQTGLQLSDLTMVGFYENPSLKLDRLLTTYLDTAPFGYSSFRYGMPAWISGKLDVRKHIRTQLKLSHTTPIFWAQHHQSHAASAFYPSPFESAAILTVDGVGEWATTTRGIGRGNSITMLDQIHFPHSLGLLYSAFTSYLGFEVNDGEYKVMGLAPFGEPTYHDTILQHLITLHPDGSFHLNMRHFAFTSKLTMTSPSFHKLFHGPPRKPHEPLTDRHRDIAASIQAVIEDILLMITRQLQQTTQLKQLVMAGGVALNCKANQRLLEQSGFEQIWIQPASGDAGGALGIAYWLYHQHLNQPRHLNPSSTLLGPSFFDSEIEIALKSAGLDYDISTTSKALCETVASALSEQKLVGWFQDRMEFGPRALGSRSILADPRQSEIRDRLNAVIKHREPFRPFAAAILQNEVHSHFRVPPDFHSPSMLLTADSHRDAASFAATTHIDMTTRLQTVSPQDDSLFAAVLKAFHQLTGCPAVLNTSFNVNGEPIVCTPQDAIRCFLASNLDLLAIGHFLVERSRQPQGLIDAATQDLAFQVLSSQKQRQERSVIKIPFPPSLSSMLQASIAINLLLYVTLRQFAFEWKLLLVIVLMVNLILFIPIVGHSLLSRLLDGVNWLAAWVILNWGAFIIYFFLITPYAWAARLFGTRFLSCSSKSISSWQTCPINYDQSPYSSSRYAIVFEFLQFLMTNRKWWLIPLVLSLLLYGSLLAVSLSGGLTIIYTLF